MRNYKLEKELTGDNKWPRIATVLVKGIKGEAQLKSRDDEQTIQSWKNVAIMKAKSDAPLKFYIGFCKGNDMAYLDCEFKTDLTFAMRIGAEDVNFFTLPKNLKDEINLELIDITTENNEKYKNTILI